MLIFGHPALPCENFVRIFSVEEIAKTSAKNILWFEGGNAESYALGRHCKENGVAYAVRILTLKDALIFANLGANFLVAEGEALAKKLQKIADEYFFDAKILLVIAAEGDLEGAAEMGIDGVIFKDCLN